MIGLVLLTIPYSLLDSFPMLFVWRGSQVWVIVATISVAASGFAINAYYSIAADEINKPDGLASRENIIKSSALKISLGLCAISIATASLGSVVAGYDFVLVMIFPIVGLALFVYAAVLKRIALLGNLLVSSLAGFLMIMPVFFLHEDVGEFIFVEYSVEQIGSSSLGLPNIGSFGFQQPPSIMFSLLIYAVPFFLTTLTRLLIKDLEDKEGNHNNRNYTLPDVAGTIVTKSVITLVALLLCVSLAILFETGLKFFHPGNVTSPYLFFGFIYTSAVLGVFMFYLFQYYLWTAKTQADYHQLSKYLKRFMIMGVIFMLIIGALNYPTSFTSDCLVSH